MDEEKRRRRTALLGSAVFHVLLVLIISLAGLFGYHKVQENIVEVALFGGGGGGGGSSGEVVQDEAAQEEESDEAAEEDFEELDEESIMEESKDSNAPKPVRKARKHRNSAAVSATEGGSGGGNGSGVGTGNGSGTGEGSGSGSGGGNGSGYGSGDGYGIGDGISENPAVPPRIARSVSPRYPSRERNAGIEGTAVVRFLIGYSGEVESVSIEESSGNTNLDQAALDACAQWRFTGAQNAAGQSVRCYARMPITFRLR